MPQYDMSIDPATWPRPDDVDLIQAAERYEMSEDYIADALDWAVTDLDAINCIADRFAMTDAYERGFRVWLDRQIP